LWSLKCTVHACPGQCRANLITWRKWFTGDMWITALVLGLAGSVHCAAMCSPLAFAVTTLTPSALLNRIIYNAGRIFTYGLLGALFSGVGLLLPIGQYQNILSIAVGAMLVVVGVFGFGAIRIQGVTTVLNTGTIGFKELF